MYDIALKIIPGVAAMSRTSLLLPSALHVETVPLCVIISLSQNDLLSALSVPRYVRIAVRSATQSA